MISKERIQFVRKWLKYFLYSLLELLVIKIIPSPKNKSGLLLIRLDAIGDFILWQDSVAAIRQLYPAKHYRITLLGNSVWKELAQALPHWDEVWVLDRKKFESNIFYRYHWLKKIRQTGFQIVIQPTYSRRLFVGDAFIHVSDAQHRIGFSGDCSNIKPWQKKYSDKWYTKLISASTKPLMELERNAEFVRGLGLPTFRAGLPQLVLAQNISNLSLEGLDDNVCYYILFPGASWYGRQWPIDKFAKLAAKIYQKTKFWGVIAGGVNDVSEAEKICQQSRVPLRMVAGKTSLLDLFFLIKNAQFLVGNETSAIHIAAATQTPSVCVLGGGHFGRFMPYVLSENIEQSFFPVAVYNKMPCYGCNWFCKYSVEDGQAVPCVREISEDEVWNEVLRIIKKL